MYYIGATLKCDEKFLYGLLTLSQEQVERQKKKTGIRFLPGAVFSYY